MNGSTQPTSTSMLSEPKKSAWTWIVLVFVILILAGVILWYLNYTQEDGDLSPLARPSSLDEASAIEMDLQATDVENLDSELEDIERELVP